MFHLEPKRYVNVGNTFTVTPKNPLSQPPFSCVTKKVYEPVEAVGITLVQQLQMEFPEPRDRLHPNHRTNSMLNEVGGIK